VKSLKLEEREENQFVVRVEGCIWASRVHKLVNINDVTCPFAMVTISLYEKFKGKLVNEKESEYRADGTETIVEPSRDLKFVPNSF
jgi:hypothetical protein